MNANKKDCESQNGTAPARGQGTIVGGAFFPLSSDAWASLAVDCALGVHPPMWGFSKLGGTFVGSLFSRDPTMWGLYSESPHFGTPLHVVLAGRCELHELH